MLKIIISNKNQLPEAAGKILEYASGRRLLAFYGLLGAGKTTIIKAVCSLLGAVDTVSSPTFTLVNEYKTESGEFLYHIDFYRIKKIDEVFDFGLEEYFASGSYCLIEWPELIGDILPGEAVKIRINVDRGEQRILELS